MKIDLTCPAEVWRTALPEAERPVCELTLYNLSDKLIVSVEVTLTLQDAAGEEIARVIHRAHDLHGLPEKPFGMLVPVEESAAPASAEVLVEKIWFDDNSVWRRSKLPLSEYTPNALPNSRALENLRYIAGKDAVGYPQEQPGLWLCVCGRPNANGSRMCIRCHRNRTEVFANLNREAVEQQTSQRERQLDLKARAARENASRHQALREKEYEEKMRRRKKRIALITAGAVCLAAAYGAVFHLLPYLRYRSAVELMEAGSYQEAIAAFSEMSGDARAEENILRCTYLDAVNQLASGDEAVLAGAQATLEGLGDYEDAAAQARQAQYLRAGLLLERGSVDEARSLYTALEGDMDCAAQIARCDYLTAAAQLEAGDYEAARAAFTALGEYEDAPDMAKEAVYRPAAAALEAGDAEEAIALLEEIPGYADADAQLARAWYLKGQQLREAGELTEAGAAFLKAGAHEDAARQANECLYQAADEAAQRKDHVTAAALFGEIPDYLDALDRWQAETYTLAVDAMDDLEYIRARSLLATLPEDYEDVATLRLEAIYRPAVTAYKKADFEAAIEGFSQLGDYRDSAEQLLKSRYRLAEEKQVAGDYEGALALYEMLGDYEDTQDQIRLTHYQQGVQAIAQGNYARAMELFEALGSYKDSGDKLKEATYDQAAALQAAGDYAGARPLYASLGKYSDAQQQVPACDYGMAAAMASAGQAEEAAALYLSLGDYQDAKAQGQALYYALGRSAQAEGRDRDAAAYYELIPGYEDADSRVEAIYDAAYALAQSRAQQAVDGGEYALAVAILLEVDMTELPEKYAALPDMLREACYQEANRLYAAGKTYEALPFYRMIPGYRNVDSVLERSCYLILGQWLGADGQTYTFLPDGTCSLNGEKLYFAVSAYAMQTGIAPDALSLTHKVSSIAQNDLTLRDIRDGQNIVIRLTRDEEYVLPELTPELPEVPEPDPTPVPAATDTPSPEEMPLPTAEADASDALPLPAATEDPTDSFQVEDD
ncbi:MAG: hypothetical protein ACI4O7_03475 [Aristaeellaceae bacterium]